MKKTKIKKKIKSQKKENTKINLLVFLVKFFVIFIFGTILISYLDLSDLISFESKTVANFSDSVYLDGKLVSPDNIFVITNSCLGLMTITIFAGLIFSTKYPALDKKIVLFLLGAILLFLLNIPRLILVVSSTKFGFDADLIHTLTWYLMSLVALVIWYYGIKMYYKKEPNELL